MFGPQDYDPFALDLWALGATLAEFFTPLEDVSLRRVGDDWGGGDSDDDDYGHFALDSPKVAAIEVNSCNLHDYPYRPDALCSLPILLLYGNGKHFSGERMETLL